MDVVEIPTDETSEPVDVWTSNTSHPVFEAVLELRRLGLTYKQIRDQSGCDGMFLNKIFQTLGLSRNVAESHVPQKPFHNSDWVRNLRIEWSEDEDEDEYEEEYRHNLQRKEEEIRQMKLQIEELERHKGSGSRERPVSADSTRIEQLKEQIEANRKTLRESNRTCLELNESIRKLDSRLRLEKAKLEKELEKVDLLEESMSLNVKQLDALETKMRLENEIVEEIVAESEETEEFATDEDTDKDEEAQQDPVDPVEDESPSLNERNCIDVEETPHQPQRDPNNILDRFGINMTSPEKFKEYKTTLSGMKSYRFRPNFDHSKLTSPTFSNHIDPDKKFCPYEVSNGTCSRENCGYQHFKDVVLNGNELILELTRDLPASSPEEYKTLLNQLSKELLESKSTQLATLYEIIKDFRQNVCPKSSFLNLSNGS